MLSRAMKLRCGLKQSPVGVCTFSQFSSSSLKNKGVNLNHTTKRGYIAGSSSDMRHSATQKYDQSAMNYCNGLLTKELIRYQVSKEDLLEREQGGQEPWTVHVRDKGELRDKVKAMRNDGPANTMIIADFDQTISSYYVPDSIRSLRNERMKRVKGVEDQMTKEEGPMMTEATIRIMLECERVTQEDIEETRRLFAKYRPIEIDPSLGITEKYKHMYDWLFENLKLFASLQPTDSDLRSMVSTSKMACRHGIIDLLEQVKVNDIPFVVVSGGVKEVIEVIFYELMREKLNKGDTSYNFSEFESLRELYNLVVISNTFEFQNIRNQQTGKFERMITDFDRKILTPSNKFEFVNETYADVLAPMMRQNLVVMGDQLHDTQLIDPSNHTNILSVGFLNDSTKQDMNVFLDHFDVVICRDGPLLPVNVIMDTIAMDDQGIGRQIDFDRYEQYPELQELCDIVKS